jgi:midasin (ATPase involved in ribosome maturation)
VLDRLNGLLEPGGVLRMDERGIVGGGIKEVTPHPNFRYAYKEVGCVCGNGRGCGGL